MTASALGVLLIIVSGVIEGVAQVCFKKSALAPQAKLFWVGAGIALFAAQAGMYTGGLQFVEVSTAFPITSVGFVAVAVLSQRFLGEPVTRARWIGIALIVIGVALLAAEA
ncbi:MAG TPA: EamA family transporter [Burkholderiales bacterium]|nr:EamA family transporter [Burkholderiales bacterium]